MYKGYVEQMSEAKNAKERKAVVDEMCRMFAFSQAKAYRLLKENGWESGRKKRRDAGKTAVDEKIIKALAALTKQSLRKNGKQVMPVTVARSVLVQNGWDVPVNNSRLCDLLRTNKVSTSLLKQASPHQHLRSLYPNQVHMADPSVSLLYYSPRGKQKIIRDDEQYKNKSFLEGKEKCLRYVLVDHFSGSICVRYYSALGESAINMYDFLLYAWGQKKNPVYTFHGLPEMLYWDKGSGNINKATTAALEALRIKTDTHKAGNPRAKGAVEVANDIVETHFESLLKLEEVISVEELNEAVERWCAAFNANLIPGYDSTLVRMGKSVGSRHELWQRITAEQLRELPDAETCRLIFTNGIQARTVAGDLTVSVYHPKAKEQLRYSVNGIPGILSGDMVNIQPILVDPNNLALVMFEHNGQVLKTELEPIEMDEAGFVLSGAIIGSEYKQPKDTQREVNNKKLEQIITSEKGVAFSSVTDGKGFKSHSLIHPENSFIQQITGEPIEVVTSTIQRSELYISYVEGAKRFKARTGFLPEGFISDLKKEYADGVTVKIIDDLAQEYNGGNSAIKHA